MDWSSWFQQVAGNTINAATEAQFRQPYEIQKLQLQQQGPYGPYVEGQAMPGTVGGINTTWLLLGGALLVAVVLLKD